MNQFKRWHDLKKQWVLMNLVFSSEEEKKRECQLLKNPAYANHWAKKTGFKKLDVPLNLSFSDPSDFIDIEVNGKTYTVTIDSWYHENDGIGAYEYWGFKCYDRGHDYAVVEAVAVEHAEKDADAAYLEWYLNCYCELYCDSLPSHERDEPDDDDYFDR